MKVVSTDALTKLIQLSKDNFVDKTDTVQATTVQLATVATTGDYTDLTNKPAEIPSQTGQSGKFLSTNGTTASWATVSATPSTDDETINTNSNDELQAIGVIDDNNNTALKIWTGTTAEYDEIDTPDASTMYIIKDNYTPANVETLFDCKWLDHTEDSICWKNSNDFAWINGNMYTSAYNHLVDEFTDAQAEQGTLDIQNDTIVPSYSETIGSYTIYYYLAEDGHKIIMPDSETTATNIYNESGIAWYYILDTGNHRFKLPRTKYGFTGLRDAVGKYVPAGLPNITGSVTNLSAGRSVTPAGSGALSVSKTGTWSKSGTDSPLDIDTISLNASNSNSIYGNSTTVQQPATQMYLYFYVGNIIVNNYEIEINGLANRSLSNVDSNIDYVIETQRPTAENNYTWYRLYKSGWVEQGQAQSTSGSGIAITLPKEMADTHYTINLGGGNSTGWGNAPHSFTYYNISTTGFNIKMEENSTLASGMNCSWEVKGFAAQS